MSDHGPTPHSHEGGLTCTLCIPMTGYNPFDTWIVERRALLVRVETTSAALADARENEGTWKRLVDWWAERAERLERERDEARAALQRVAELCAEAVETAAQEGIPDFAAVVDVAEVRSAIQDGQHP